MTRLRNIARRHYLMSAFIILLSLPLLSAACKKGPAGPSSKTEFLEVKMDDFPEDQYNTVEPRPDAEEVIDSGRAVKITFYGATRIVGGSCMVLEYEDKKILIDAGIFYMESLIPLDKRFEFDPAEIDYFVLTHAHGDHNARIPILYRRGYRGKIYATPPTRDISDIMLQLGEGMTARRFRVDFKNKSVHSRDCSKARALKPDEFLDIRSARAWTNNVGYHACSLCREMVRNDKAAISKRVEQWFELVESGELVELADNIKLRLHNAGHILGSSQAEFILGEGEEAIRLVFCGDYGNRISPLIKTPDHLENADYVITEATYGCVKKDFNAPYFKDFTDAVVAAVRRGERVIIPAFVLSKSQKVISVLAEEAYLGRIPKNCPIIVSSPTVAALNQVYQKYLEESPKEYFTERSVKRRKWRNPFLQEQFYFGSINSYRKKYGDIGTPAIFLVSSGMMDFASALEMAEKYLSSAATNFFIVGWQAPTSVGRAAMKLDEVVIKGKTIPVRAKVKKFGQFSSHGDLNMLLENILSYNDLKGAIIQHGEAECCVNLAHLIHQDGGIPVFVPAFLDSIWLDKKSFLKVEHNFSFTAQKARQLHPALELPSATLKKKYQVAYNNLAQAEKAYRKKRLSLALKFARDATFRYPALADAYYLMGKIYRDKGMESSSRESFLKAIKVNPYDSRFYLGLAQSYLEEGETAEAINQLRTCLYYQPEDIEALALLGEIYCHNDLKMVGLEILKVANSIDPYNEVVADKVEEMVRMDENRRVYYVSSQNSRFFHYPWCPFAQKISQDNLVKYSTRTKCLQAGLTPCAQCAP